MTDSTRATIWHILNNAFHKVLHTVQADVPTVRMSAGHSQNEAFLFRAFAQYSAGGIVVVISFDVQVQNLQVHVFGDLAWEDGLIIKSLMETVIGSEACDEQFLISQAYTFASQCEHNAFLIASALGEGRKEARK
jgi:hypothetical protein